MIFGPGSEVAAELSGKQRSPTPEQRKISDLQAARERVRQQRAKRAVDVDVLKASSDEVQQALGDLTISVDATTSQLEDARRAVDQAVADQADAAEAQQVAAGELAGIRGHIVDQAVAAYVSSPRDSHWDAFSDANELNIAKRKTLIEFVETKSLDQVDHYRAIQEDLAIAKQQADDAKNRAASQRRVVSQRVTELQAARLSQEQYAAQVESRLEASLAEADSLASIDSALATQITVQQTALAVRLDAQRRSAQAARSMLTRSGRRTSGAAPGADIPARAFPTANSAGITNVQGIQINNSVAVQLGAMIDAARSAGITLSGGGYRNPAAQIAVRRNNCGSSNYALYQASASSCRPPTARPGQSMHEQGLAIDFTAGGRTLNRGSAEFRWLAANAANYGFYNLPSEPWHWSTNGN